MRCKKDSGSVIIIIDDCMEDKVAIADTKSLRAAQNDDCAQRMGSSHLISASNIYRKIDVVEHSSVRMADLRVAHWARLDVSSLKEQV